MTPKITLYTVAPSQNAVRPELTLLEKGIPFEKIQVDLLGGEHKQPPCGKITPRRQVPTPVYGEGDEAISVYESKKLKGSKPFTVSPEGNHDFHCASI